MTQACLTTSEWNSKQRHANKKVYLEFMNSKNKVRFRAEHESADSALIVHQFQLSGMRFASFGKAKLNSMPIWHAVPINTVRSDAIEITLKRY